MTIAGLADVLLGHHVLFNGVFSTSTQFMTVPWWFAAKLVI